MIVRELQRYYNCSVIVVIYFPNQEIDKLVVWRDSIIVRIILLNLKHYGIYLKSTNKLYSKLCRPFNFFADDDAKTSILRSAV